MSYFPDCSPGMMVAKVALTGFHLMPMAWPRALPRSASKPMIVCPSDAMNSSGGYVASMATVTPLALMALGTSAATCGTAPLVAAADAEPLLVDVVGVRDLLYDRAATRVVTMSVVSALAVIFPGRRRAAGTV